ncbi:hypothetical protein OIU79_026667, partial [Salix purpurea]
MLQKEFV